MKEKEIERLQILLSEIRGLCEDRLDAFTAGGMNLNDALTEAEELVKAQYGKVK